MPTTTTLPDPSWALSISQRDALLWLGGSFHSDGEYLTKILSRPWSAVYVDAPSGVDREAVGRLQIEPLVARFFSEDAGPASLPPNRVPFYALRGPRGDVTWDRQDDPQGLLRRMMMLRQAPRVRWVFVLGVRSEADWAALLHAQRLSEAFRNLIVIGPDPLWDSRLDEVTERAFLWDTTPHEFGILVDPVTVDDALSDFVVALRTSDGIRTVDLSGAVDSSSPITLDFDLIPASAALQSFEPSQDLLGQLLEDPTSSWVPYAAGVAYPRVETYVKTLMRELASFEEDGPAASKTAWVPAEPASGATTALRHLGLEIARQGYPVLVATVRGRSIDFSRLKAFLLAASDRIAAEGVSVPELPWVILFDAEHVQVHWDVMRGVASGLRKLQRSAIVAAVRPTDSKPPEGAYQALGDNVALGPPLTNSLGEEEVARVGEHFSRILPAHLHRGRQEWVAFLEDSVRTAVGGRRSLFWLALRFWLFRLPGAGESLRTWIASKRDSLLAGEDSTAAALLEVCALAKYRLVTPSVILAPEAAAHLRRVAWDRTNPLGIVLVDIGDTEGITLVHPLIAEELLRLAVEDPLMLAAVGMGSCLGLLDLELFILARLIRRPSVSCPAGISVVENLVTTGLRVDQREAPRNYQVRDRIVNLLEEAPDSVWDNSQVFNHHLARARRHLAIDPPAGALWDAEARREQFRLSEYHLLDAIENIRPDDPDRQESPLNLQVSLALTLDHRARFEEEREHPETAGEYRQRADRAFAEAQRLDADNSYVLENFARFKLREAERVTIDQERISLIVDAITLLETEFAGGDRGHRDEQVLSEMARAYELLERGRGVGLLQRMMGSGNEAAAVALAKVRLYSSSGEDRASELDAAFELLDGIPHRLRTWRTPVTLYRIVSERSPWDFPERLGILEELEVFGDFVWPLQLRLEFGILLFQVGDEGRRKRGRDVYRDLRDVMAASSGVLHVPSEMRFLADPAHGFKRPLMVRIRIKRASDVGRNAWAIPDGWYGTEVPLRPIMFAGAIRTGDERDCLIQFTNFGPQAVPPTVMG